MKKFLSLFLALVMMAALVPAAMAEETSPSSGTPPRKSTRITWLPTPTPPLTLFGALCPPSKRSTA